MRGLAAISGSESELILRWIPGPSRSRRFCSDRPAHGANAPRLSFALMLMPPTKT